MTHDFLSHPSIPRTTIDLTEGRSKFSTGCHAELFGQMSCHAQQKHVDDAVDDTVLDQTRAFDRSQ